MTGVWWLSLQHLRHHKGPTLVLVLCFAATEPRALAANADHHDLDVLDVPIEVEIDGSTHRMRVWDESGPIATLTCAHPRPRYTEISQIGAEFAKLSSALADTRPVNEVALVDRWQDRWPLRLQPHHENWDHIDHRQTYYDALLDSHPVELPLRPFAWADEAAVT